MIAEVYGALNGALAQTLQGLRSTLKNGGLSVGDLQARFQEAAYRGSLYTLGMGLTAINAATFTTATTGATATPILGIYNPLGSGKNAIVSQAMLGLTMTALQATGAGPFAWMATAAAGPISTGSAPFNVATLQQIGSVCKNVSGVALTGMTGALAVVRGSSLFGGSASNAAFLATAVAMQTQQQSAVENIDGSIIVPPNAVLALMATTTPVGHSAVSGLLHEEVAI